MRRLAALALLVVVSACGWESDDSAGTPTAATAAEAACADVRAGIDAFNTGDYDTTVERFVEAIEPAEEYVRLDGGAEADQLLEAVQYYADLAPEDYPESARSSQDFAKYKAITLGQCEPVGSGEPSPDLNET